MSGRSAKLLAWSLFSLFVVLVALGVVLELTGGVDSDENFLIALASGYAIGGVLVATRQPRNAIGWIMCALALNFALNALAAGYVEPVSDPRERLAGELVLTYYLSNEEVWIPLVGIFLPLLFPNGRLPSRRWRVLAWLAACAIALGVVSSVFAAGTADPSEWPGVENPFGIGGAVGRALDAAGFVSAALLVPCIIGAGASVVVRLRRAQGDERQQLKWFAYAAGLMAAALLVALAAAVAEEAGAEETTWGYAVGASGWFTALFMVLIGLPVAIGLAIFRYRLYDIDVVINRTLVYGSLTALLAGTYLGAVLLLGLALGPVTEGNELAVAVSTLAVAALVRPARRRIQEAVDRRFYRRKYDAERTLAAFSARLRDQVELEALAADLRAVVSETVQPAHVSLWLREAGR